MKPKPNHFQSMRGTQSKTLSNGRTYTIRNNRRPFFKTR